MKEGATCLYRARNLVERQSATDTKIMLFCGL
jgi:hypothetical protein